MQKKQLLRYESFETANTKNGTYNEIRRTLYLLLLLVAEISPLLRFTQLFKNIEISMLLLGVTKSFLSELIDRKFAAQEIAKASILVSLEEALPARQG